MVKSFSNVIIIIGIISIVLIGLFFGYIYYTSIPSPEDLKTFPVVRVPEVEDRILEYEIRGLIKQEGIPVTVDEFELGKENPYF